ncbi:glycosyltransferase family 4 protein, partial [Candidatus Pacearchaeota archaeon]|nr:glycosyltransferase family 4 protein [Candidatus Pacearchaeota archaeon]
MKILEICPFSAGICGVWTRAKQESLEFSKLGHKVTIFSSNIEKGTNKLVPSYEKVENVEIKRFKGRRSFFSENVINFNFKRELAKTNPDLVITHLIHPHSFKALKICRKKRSPCYLVTHAPFFAKRNFLLSLITNFYYLFWAKLNMNKFTKILTITKWEISYLLNLGVSKKKITYIPNGIPQEFFKEKITKFQGKNILFIGRIAPVKDIETLISAFKRIDKKNIRLKIIGPVEQGYEHIKNSKSKNIEFLESIFDLKKKIKKLQEADIFILPSKREAMP